MDSGIGVLEQFTFNSMFGGDKKKKTTTPPPDQQLSGLSPLANSVVARCSKILGVVSPQVLQQQFEADFSSTIHTYAKHLIEYCSFKAFHLLTHRSDYLTTKDFRRFTYDVMLAWEDAFNNNDDNEKIMTVDHEEEEEEEEDGWSLFYTNSINMALQVDQEKTVGPEAFARIAPACPVVADIITVRNLFDVLTASSDGRLHFVVYDKFLGTLDKVIKTAKFASGAPLCSTLQLSEGEIVLNVDGTVPTQPVLQHIGISAWPGRLTLTNYALYFESGVGLYDKPVRYDLAMELKQVVKPELTGPLGARLFDKAVMYKSTQLAEPVYFEFPEFKGSSRRDYWLDIILEVLRAHKFIRKYNFKDSQKREAVAKAILGIFRLRAVREAFHIFPSGYKTLLDYNLAEKLPRGDMILETLSSRIQLLSRRTPDYGAVGIPSDTKQLPLLSPASLLALKKLGFLSETVDDADEETEMPIGDVSVGETNPIELAIKQSQCDTSRAETAQATVDQVKIEGLDTNIAVMKDLLFPVVESVKRLHVLASWEDPFKSTVFLVLVCYTIYRDWMRYAIPCMLLFLVMLILWRRQQSGKQQHLEVFKVTSPPTMNPVEQLLALQEALSHLETFLQAGNISLLKVRALVFSALPQATDKVIVGLLVMAAIFVIVPLKAIVALAALEVYTREMPLRKDCSDRWARRLREWWIRIPAAPVVLIKKT